MKNEKYFFALRHWHIFILAYFLIIPISCRSNRNLDSAVQTDTESASTTSSVQKDSMSSQSHSRDSTSDIASERQYLRTTWYRPDGSIRKVQESGRQAERNRVAIRNTGSSDVHLSENKADSTAVTKAQSKEVIHEDTDTDSRPVQGSEWGWFAGAFVLIAVVFGYWEYRKNK